MNVEGSLAYFASLFLQGFAYVGALAVVVVVVGVVLYWVRRVCDRIWG